MSDKTPASDFNPSGFFALRTPLLPFDELLAFSDGLEAPSAGDDPAQLAAALAADRAHLRERLRTAFTRPEVREALFVASPDLEERFALWLRQPESEAGQKIERPGPSGARLLDRPFRRPAPGHGCLHPLKRPGRASFKENGSCLSAAIS
jgi:hypothetical protein